MSSFILFFSCLLFFIRFSMPEDTIDFEGRWITRPPYNNELTYAVVIKMTTAEDEFCSGALLTAKWVLTAARCLYKDGKVVETNTSLTVYAGVYHKMDSPDVQSRSSKQVLIHNLPHTNSYFSIALVQVDPPFKTTSGNVTITFLNLEFIEGFLEIDEVCRTGSYGQINWSDHQPIALKKTMSIIQSCNCSGSLQETFPDVHTDQWICGEYLYNIGLCRGDFGAALECGRDRVGVAIDIVTFGDLETCVITDKVSQKCSEPSTISIYVDVCHYLGWIHSHVPQVPANTTPCYAPDSTPSLHTSSWQCALYFILAYLLFVSSII